MNSPSTATPTKPVVREATATKPETVRAVAMTAPGQTEMRTYPYPTMDHDSAILKVDMAGICGTDRHIYKGEATELRGKSIFPYVGGHEVIGTIVEIGDNAAKVLDYDKQPLAVGDRVALAVEVNCGHCVYCRKHYNNTTCLNQIQAYGLHPNCETQPYLRGGFAEYMYIRPGTHLFKVPEGMPTDIAVFVEEMAVAYHSVGRAAGPFAPVNEGFGPGQSVAILGNGPLGILHGIMASIHGAGLRIATDLSDLRLGIAEGLYADVTLNASQISEKDRIAQVQDMTDGVGPGLGHRICWRAGGLHRGIEDGSQGRNCDRSRQLGRSRQACQSGCNAAHQLEEPTHPFRVPLRHKLGARTENSATAIGSL